MISTLTYQDKHTHTHTLVAHLQHRYLHTFSTFMSPLRVLLVTVKALPDSLSFQQRLREPDSQCLRLVSCDYQCLRNAHHYLCYNLHGHTLCSHGAMPHIVVCTSPNPNPVKPAMRDVEKVGVKTKMISFFDKIQEHFYLQFFLCTENSSSLGFQNIKMLQGICCWKYCKMDFCCFRLENHGLWDHRLVQFIYQTCSTIPSWMHISPSKKIYIENR